jgi:hypothetical protein
LEQIPENVSPAEFLRVSVGVTANGDLVVWCVRHDEPITMHKQGQIDADLLAIVNEPCAGCGGLHTHEGKKEKLH